jgi:hypothetical protein
MVFSNDIFKALYSGRYLRWFGQFPHHSTFTFNPVVNHLTRDSFNWLGNLGLIEVYETAGYTGLQVLRGVLVLITVFCIHSLFDWNRHPIFLLTFFFVVMSLSQKFILRTAIVAAPALALLIWTWVRSEYDDRKNYLWLIPVLLMVWSQIHGSYQLGLALYLLLIAGELLDRAILRSSLTTRAIIRYGSVLLLSVLAVTFVKPFPDYSFPNQVTGITKRVLPVNFDRSGPDSGDKITQRDFLGRPFTLPAIQERYNRVDPPDRSTSETSSWYFWLRNQLQTTIWGESVFRSDEFAFPFDRLQFLSVRSGLFLGIVSLVILLLPPYRPVFSVWIPIAAFLILGSGYLRTVGYLGLVPVALLSLQLRGPLSRNLKGILWTPMPIYACMLAIALLIGNAGSLTVNGTLEKLTGNAGHEIGWGQHQRMAPDVPRILVQKYPDQRFFNSYNAGSYLIWQWWPHKKVFVDTKFSAYAPSFKKFVTQTPLPEILRAKNLRHAVFERHHFWNYYFSSEQNWAFLISDPYFAAYKRNQPL